MTATLKGVEWSAARPGRTLPPEKTRYPFYSRLGGPQGWSGRAENKSSYYPTKKEKKTETKRQYTQSTNNNYTKDNLKLATKHTRQIRILQHVQKV